MIRFAIKSFIWAFLLVVFHSCKKDNDPADLRLDKLESTDYVNNVVITEYTYDNQGRMTSISKKRNNEDPVVTVTISYNGNEATLLSFPDYDPSLNQQSEVRFILDASGKPLKRTEFTKRISKNIPIYPHQEYINDTLIYEYDAAGLLKQTTGSRRDSIWIQADHTVTRKITVINSYSNVAGNLVSSDEYITYPSTETQGGVITISGGSSRYRKTFYYTKGYPNKTDFKNAFVLNEYRLSHESLLNSNYKNMHEEVAIHNMDWDINGAVIFDSKGNITMDRTYDGNGFLSSVIIPPGSTQDVRIIYSYKRR
ncbi:MAG: hypothetical protein ABWZ25_16455 [Chitinophagaceae bacterium]